MRIPSLLILSIALLWAGQIYGQASTGNSTFLIKGHISGRDTGAVMFWYNDQRNDPVSDTMRLHKGDFQFSGNVNRVCEAYLWTDMNNKVLDDASVVRFLLEPGNISIFLTKGDESNVVIKGSKSQIERQNWDKKKAYLLTPKTRLYEFLYSLYKNAGKDPAIGDTINKIGFQIDSINKRIMEVDIAYIRTHANSYLSGYLLSQQKRKLSLDSLQSYYTALSKNVQRSSVGHDVLDYVYPLTDDQQFRKAHPLVDLQFDERLRKINSVYEFSLRDTSGTDIDLRAFKGKYLLIDFWASWCKPCIANVPSLNKMINEYQSDSIHFVSISLDKDIMQWKQSLKKNNFTGVQLCDLNGFKSLIAVYCKVLWVPKYIIADKNGRVINYDAPQPSEPELKTLLDGLLNRR